MHTIKINIFKSNIDYHIVSLINGFPFIISIITSLILHFLNLESLFYFFLCLSMIVLWVVPIITYFYTNAQLGFLDDGLLIEYKDQELFFKWEEINEIKFFKSLDNTESIWPPIRVLIVTNKSNSNGEFELFLYKNNFKTPANLYKQFLGYLESIPKAKKLPLSTLL